MPSDAQGSVSAGGRGSPDLKKEDSVVIDMGGDPEEMLKLREERDRARKRSDGLQEGYDREVAGAKRLRAEVGVLKEKIEDLGKEILERDNAVTAQERVTDELRKELDEMQSELNRARDERGGLEEKIASRERQVARAQEETAKLREDMDEVERRLADVSRTKDEGWKKLNEQLAEIEHLREVINEQERMLEERLVGLVSQEEVIKGLRSDKENSLKERAALRAERDELRTDIGRKGAQLEAVDEENRRLSALFAEAQSSALGSSTTSAQHTVKLTNELKELRIEVKTTESDRDRLQELLDRAEGEVEKLQEESARLEVDLRDAQDARAKASSAKSVAEEAMAKAEIARHKAAEEALEAAQARDAAMSSADKLRRDVDRGRRKIRDLEEPTQTSDFGGGELEGLLEENEMLKRELRNTTEKLRDLERSMASMGAQAEASRLLIDVTAHGARLETTAHGAELDAKNQAPDTQAFEVEISETTAVVAPDDNPAKLHDKAIEVHDEINDVLSELRNNIVIVKGELEIVSEGDSSDSMRIIVDTMETIVGNAEDAKGILRSLRELVEFGK
jgi:chromosome segregation ATPase